MYMPGDADAGDIHGSIDMISPIVGSTTTNPDSAETRVFLPTDTGISPSYNLFTGYLHSEMDKYHSDFGSCIVSNYNQNLKISDYIPNSQAILLSKTSAFTNDNTYTPLTSFLINALTVVNADASNAEYLMDSFQIDEQGDGVNEDCIALATKFNAIKKSTSDDFKASMIANFKFPLTIEKQDDGGNVEDSITINLDTAYNDTVNGLAALRTKLTDLGFEFPEGSLGDPATLHLPTT